MNDEIYKFMFIHLFCVEIGDKEADIVTLETEYSTQI